MEKTKYASARVKADTYREMKMTAINDGIPFTKLMDEMLKAYKDAKVACTKNDEAFFGVLRNSR